MKINFHYIIEEFANLLKNQDNKIQDFDEYVIQAKEIFETYVDFTEVSNYKRIGSNDNIKTKLSKDGNFIKVKKSDLKTILQLLKQSPLKDKWDISLVGIIYEIEKSLLLRQFPFNYTYYLYKIYQTGYFMSPGIHIHEKKVLEHKIYDKYFKISQHIPTNFKEYKLIDGQAFTTRINDIDVYHLTNKGTKRIEKMLSQIL